jgi:hypothetical protein
MTPCHRISLNLIPLDDRLAPAAFSYSAGTLTVIPETGDAVTVDPTGDSVPGFLRVVAGATFFESGSSQPVWNLVVKGSAALNYDLTFGTGVSLTNLTVKGASGLGALVTDVSLEWDTRISGNFTFNGHPAGGDDRVFLPGPNYIGGNMTLKLRGGNNFVNMGAGAIGGNFAVTAGAGNDAVTLLATGPVTIGRDFKLKLGDGANRLNGLVPFTPVVVGRNFSFIGGSGDDRINFHPGAPLRVGGSVTVDLRASSPAFIPPVDYWQSDALMVGRNFTVRGGREVNLYGPNDIGGNVAINPGPGNGIFRVGWSEVALGNTSPTAIGGSVGYAGGTGDDLVSLDHVAVGRSVNLNLGASIASQRVEIGTTQPYPAQIHGSLTIRGDIGISNLIRTLVGGSLGIFLSDSSDVVVIDDTDIGGATLIDLRGGADSLSIDTRTNDLFLGVVLDDRTRFQSSFTVYGRAGADFVSLGSPFGGTGVNFGGPVRLFGGAENDSLVLLMGLGGNLYLNTRTEDFDFGNDF